MLATGGASYPATGSTGDGYELARSVGHSVWFPPRPSWCRWRRRRAFCGEMQGLALKNVILRMKDRKGKVLFQEQGELLFHTLRTVRPPDPQCQRPSAGF
ncbi:MAG: hypothetical protein ACLUJG_02485 [Lawsonibacter sp.]